MAPLGGVAYTDRVEGGEEQGGARTPKDSWGGSGRGGWVGVDGAWGASATVIAAPVIPVDVIIKLFVASLYLYLKISVLIALSSACKDWTCWFKVEIAPMHPYTGSLSLTFAS